MAAPAQTGKPLPLWVAATLIVSLGILIYAQVYRFDFLYYDDDEYVFRNPQVISGLTPESLPWAFTSLVSKHWHPVTWLSHMLDVEMFGLNPAGHHLVNLGLHLLTALLLFRFLVRSTGDRLPALLAALLLTVHPLHAETVAWVADRKDLLCTLFWMVTLNAYAAYVKKPVYRRYVGVLLAFCLAVLSKSIALTLPVVLLLLDFWPLRRYADTPPGRNSRAKFGWLCIEKIPFFAISLAIGLIALHALRNHPVNTTLLLPDYTPLVQGPKAYLIYLARMVYPVGLITPYPIFVDMNFWVPAFCGVLALLITAGALWLRRRHPYLMVGWGWYLVTLLPVAGFWGLPRTADRYAYLTLIGIYILISWSAAAGYRRWYRLKRPLLVTFTALIGILAVSAYHQAGYWKNTLTLFQHTLRVNPASSIARVNIGIYLHKHGRIDKAIRYQQEAVKLAPRKPEYHYNLGVSYLYKNDYTRALHHFTQATLLRPDYIAAMSNRGLCLLHLGKQEQARRAFEQVLKLQPDHVYAHNYMGLYYLTQKDLKAAESQFRKAISINPKHSDALANLAGTLEAGGTYDKAEFYFREAIRVAPRVPGYYYGLAHLLTGRQKFKAAADIRSQGLKHDPQNAKQHYFLAIDDYFSGDLERARQHLAKAKELNYPGVESLFDQKLARALKNKPPPQPDN